MAISTSEGVVTDSVGGIVFPFLLLCFHFVQKGEADYTVKRETRSFSGLKHIEQAWNGARLEHSRSR